MTLKSQNGYANVDRTVVIRRPFSVFSPYHAQSAPDHFHNPVSVAFSKIISVKLQGITDRLQSENQTGSSQRQHGHGCGNINIPRVQIRRAEGTNIDRIPLVKCALKIPEMRSAIDPFPSRHEPLDAVAKKNTKLLSTSETHALLLHLFSGRGCAAGSG